MDSELQKAIDNVATYNDANPHIWGLGQIVEAARKVANPDIEAAHQARLDGETTAEVVWAALGITEDTP